MAKYLQFGFQLVPICRNNVSFSIDNPNGQWVGMVDGVVVKDFITEDEGRAWLTKIKTAIGGGDVMTVIDDF